MFQKPVYLIRNMFNQVPRELVLHDLAQAYNLGLFKHNTKYEKKFTGYLQVSDDPEDQENRHHWLRDSLIIKNMIKWTVPKGASYWLHWRPETKVMNGCANQHARALHTPCTWPPHHWMLSMYVWRRALCAQDPEQPAAGSLHADDEHTGRVVHGMSLNDNHSSNMVVFVQKDGSRRELCLNASDSYWGSTDVLCKSGGLKHQRLGCGFSIVVLNQSQSEFLNIEAMPAVKVVREACVLGRIT